MVYSGYKGNVASYDSFRKTVPESCVDRFNNLTCFVTERVVLFICLKIVFFLIIYNFQKFEIHSDFDSMDNPHFFYPYLVMDMRFGAHFRSVTNA